MGTRKCGVQCSVSRRDSGRRAASAITGQGDEHAIWIRNTKTRFERSIAAAVLRAILTIATAGTRRDNNRWRFVIMEQERRIFGASIGLVLLVAAAVSAIAQVEPGFKPLFNGKNLEGW